MTPTVSLWDSEYFRGSCGEAKAWDLPKERQRRARLLPLAGDMAGVRCFPAEHGGQLCRAPPCLRARTHPPRPAPAEAPPPHAPARPPAELSTLPTALLSQPRKSSRQGWTSGARQLPGGSRSHGMWNRALPIYSGNNIPTGSLRCAWQDLSFREFWHALLPCRCLVAVVFLPSALRASLCS